MPIPTRRELFHMWREKETLPEQVQHVSSFVFSKLSKAENTEEVRSNISAAVSSFCYRVNAKWRSCSRRMDYFLTSQSQWLDHELPVRNSVTVIREGRPPKPFEESSDVVKRRKTEELRKGASAAELSYAAQMKLRSEGKEDAAKLLQEDTLTSPTRPQKMRSALKAATNKKEVGKYTPDEALSLLIEGNLSKHQYNVMRSGALKLGSKLYPSYVHILEAKRKCYPADEFLSFQETLAEVKLQALLYSTVERLLKLQAPVISSMKPDQNLTLELISKWGCDGSSGQSSYKQQFSSDDADDSSVFVTSFVPLQLFRHDGESGQKTIVWQNPRTSSTRYCRPIRLQFMKESTVTTVAEKDYIDQQISHLSASKVTQGERDVEVTHQMVFTMIDGKVCAPVAGVSSQKCNVCGALPSEMNKLNVVTDKEVNLSTFQFGLSTLHAWIRFMECILHIAYRLNIKNWQVRGEKDKAEFKSRKEMIQTQFRKETGLLIDVPRQGGRGTSNDGNTARRFLANPSETAAITGVDISLITRFGVILSPLSSGYHVDAVKFKEFAMETARIYTSLYMWYYMPASVHKILVYGGDILAAALLPFGQLSEEAQESSNKFFKEYREKHARKCSREANLQDVFCRLLISSDPIISSIRQLPKRRKSSLSPAVLNLLSPANTSSDSCVLDTSDDE